MVKKIINKENGAITINGFTIDKHTKFQDLLAYFGKDKFLKPPYANENYWVLKQQKIGAYYIKFNFTFNEEFLIRIGFEIETEPIERIPWSNNRDVETKWIAEQMDDSSNFIWDMNIAGRHYCLKYNWGYIGVFYDFKNGTFESIIAYNTSDRN